MLHLSNGYRANVQEQTIHLLHAFQKKAQKTRQQAALATPAGRRVELALA